MPGKKSKHPLATLSRLPVSAALESSRAHEMIFILRKSVSFLITLEAIYPLFVAEVIFKRISWKQKRNVPINVADLFVITKYKV